MILDFWRQAKHHKDKFAPWYLPEVLWLPDIDRKPCPDIHLKCCGFQTLTESHALISISSVVVSKHWQKAMPWYPFQVLWFPDIDRKPCPDIHLKCCGFQTLTESHALISISSVVVSKHWPKGRCFTRQFILTIWAYLPQYFSVNYLDKKKWLKVTINTNKPSLINPRKQLWRF
jgi:hypothetical protein